MVQKVLKAATVSAKTQLPAAGSVSNKNTLLGVAKEGTVSATAFVPSTSNSFRVDAFRWAAASDSMTMSSPLLGNLHASPLQILQRFADLDPSDNIAVLVDQLIDEVRYI